MKSTEVRLRQNIGAHFRALWLIKGKRRVPETGARALLTSKGIPVVNPKEILSPVYPRNERVLDLPPRASPCPGERREVPCHVLGRKFSPIMGVPQVQLLTNSLVRTTLPEAVLERASENDPSEDERVKEAILHAHLMDSHQEKLPRILDVVNKPGITEKREYGIPLSRANKTLTYQLLLLLDQMAPEAAERQLVEDAAIQVTLKHSDRLIQIVHQSGFLLSSQTPLPRLLSVDEVQSLREEPLPSIHPMSPFINSRSYLNYSLNDKYGVPSPSLYPHTIFVHHNQPRMPHTESSFCGLTLLHAFSHAASYAKEVLKVKEGDLAQPLVVQVVHLNRQRYHLGVFQLNTLDLTGPTKNLFWSQPWEDLFGRCCFRGARPVLEGYNPRVFSLLKALHAQQ